MLGLIVGIALDWYYFNFMQNNSYIKNVAIYAIANFTVLIVNELISGAQIQIISSIIGSIIVALIITKIMEYAKSKTNSLFWFIVITDVFYYAITFVIAFIVYKIF